MTVMTDFIEPLLKLFKPPSVPDTGEFFFGLEDDLRKFSTERLKAGVRHIRRNRKFSTFPTIGECVEACNKGSDDEDGAPIPKYTLSWEDKPADIEAKRRIRMKACRLCVCKMGEDADVQGWLPALIEFAEIHDRLPESITEISACRKTAKRAANGIRSVSDAAAQAMQDGRNIGPTTAPMLAQFRRIMLDKASRDVFGQTTSVGHKVDVDGNVTAFM